MLLDPRTILAMSVALFVPISLLLFLTWQTDRRERTLLLWACSFFLFAVGCVLYLRRDHLTSFVSIDIANGVFLIGAGIGVAAARSFNGRTTSPVIVLVGAGAWFLCRQFPLFQESMTARIAAFTSLLAIYILAVAIEYWRGRADGLRARYIIVVTCALLAGFYIARWVVAATGLGSFSDSIDTPNVWMATAALLPTVVAVANAVLVIGMAKERAEMEQRRLAGTDPLTGVLNRRATFSRIETALVRGNSEQSGGAVLLFDLDFFKMINDRFGHPAGDHVLREFAAVALKCLRQSDVFGRIGGEEFIAFLPGADPDRAMAAAERIRSAFTDSRIEKDGICIPATVSIGIASSAPFTSDIDPLLAEADRALYAAKELGRDRVQSFGSEVAA